MKHKHHDLMIALSVNPALIIECRAHDAQAWRVCSPAFTPNIQYRIKPDQPTNNKHSDLLARFAMDNSLKFEQRRTDDDSWVDVDPLAMIWGGNADYRIKHTPAFKVGDIVESTVTGLFAMVTKVPETEHTGFSGVVVRGDNYYSIGVHIEHFDEDVFQLIDNPFGGEK